MIESLPNPLIFTICSFNPWVETIRLSLTCKKLRQILVIDNEQFWKQCAKCLGLDDEGKFQFPIVEFVLRAMNTMLREILSKLMKGKKECLSKIQENITSSSFATTQEVPSNFKSLLGRQHTTTWFTLYEYIDFQYQQAIFHNMSNAGFNLLTVRIVKSLKFNDKTTIVDAMRLYLALVPISKDYIKSQLSWQILADEIVAAHNNSYFGQKAEREEISRLMYFISNLNHSISKGTIVKDRVTHDQWMRYLPFKNVEKNWHDELMNQIYNDLTQNQFLTFVVSPILVDVSVPKASIMQQLTRNFPISENSVRLKFDSNGNLEIYSLEKKQNFDLIVSMNLFSNTPSLIEFVETNILKLETLKPERTAYVFQFPNDHAFGLVKNLYLMKKQQNELYQKCQKLIESWYWF